MKRTILRLLGLALALCLLWTLTACKKPAASDASDPSGSGPVLNGGETVPGDETVPGGDPSAPENGTTEDPGTEASDDPPAEDPTEPGGDGETGEEPSGGQDETGVEGSWSSQLPLDTLIAAGLDWEEGDDLPVPTFPGVTVILRMDLNADGTFRMWFDEASLTKAQEGLHDPLRQYLLDYFYEEYGLDEEAVEAALALQNTTLDEKVDELAEKLSLTNLSQTERTGCYRYENGRLYVGDEPSPTEEWFETDLRGRILVLLSASSDEAAPGFGKLLPLTFTR